MGMGIGMGVDMGVGLGWVGYHGMGIADSRYSSGDRLYRLL